MTEQETLIQATGLSKRFREQTVLEHVDFSIAKGDVVTLVGLNGSGKTTLLKLLMGLAKADSGTIIRRAGLSIGYVPQRFTLEPILPMTVGYFLTLSADFMDDVHEIAGELAVAHLMSRAVQTLSGGELQRVLLARAMLRKPELLILDEPVQGVDITGQAELYALIAGLNKRYGCAVLMVSHDLHLVMAATDKVICLNRHICCSGHPHEVSKDPVFIRLFGDQAARSMALYEHHHDHTHDMHGRVVCDHDHGGHS